MSTRVWGRTELQRFWDKVRKGKRCWLWTAAKHPGGYGAFALQGTKILIRAHRYSWSLVHGPIPRGMFVLHKCDVPSCVRPSHLWLGTQRDNMGDCRNKGRMIMPTKDARARGDSSGTAKLTSSDVRAIRRLRAIGVAQKDVAKRFRVTPNNVYYVTSRRTWKHIA